MKICRLYAVLLSVALCLSACSGRSGIATAALNESAMEWLPVNLDSAQYYAECVYNAVPKGSSDGAVAANILGDIAFLRMDYIKAAALYESVLQNSGNRVEWLAADVGMMNIYQRTSDNMAFYQYRDKALLELRGINEEIESLTESERRRIYRAETDVRIVSAIYFFELEQNEQGLAELSKIETGDRLRTDTLRFLRWNTLRGLGLVRGENGPDAFPDRMRHLYNTYQTAERNGYICQTGIALQGMATVILDAGPEALSGIDRRIIGDINPSGLDWINLAEQLSLRALQDFLHYGSLFGAIETYTQLGTCAIERGEYAGAVDWLSKAMDMFNMARDVAVPEMAGDVEVPYLEPYRDDALIVENLWIERMPLMVAPECMSRIREQMSLAYSGLGDKIASDYNRNVYLELQKTIRLDRRYEARQQLLRRMNNSLNVALVVVVAGIIFLSVFVTLFSRAIRRRNREYADVIQHVLQLCGKILSVRTEEIVDVRERIRDILNSDLAPVVGVEHIDIKESSDGGLIILECSGGRTDKDKRAVVATVAPFVAAALQSADISREIGDDRKVADKERFVRIMHTEESRRQNLLRRACYSVVSDCIPLIDRMVGEASRLDASDPAVGHHIEYISELASRAAQYNASLTQWIRMCQGEVSLHIESFGIQSLLDIIRRGERSFAQKGVRLEVCDSDAVVRADRTLTLFMLNTLADNARKFTPAGGIVSVAVDCGDEWVEISVSDTGVGLSDEDVRILRDTKVYDPQRIGIDNDKSVAKGNGFGLMNCKGIIEKYRKTDKSFDCCRFDVTGAVGKGSRFSFRLPKGVRRMLGVILMALSPLAADAQDTDTVGDSLLNVAYAYADSLYRSNVNCVYDSALIYASKAIDALNADYENLTGDAANHIRLSGDDVPAEQIWLENGFGTDYETILWLRNEVAVAALALNMQDLYRYNNDAYLMLFRRYYSDSVIERDCMQLQRSNSNIRIAIVLMVLVLIGFVVFRFVLHSRNWLRYRSDLQQILKITGRISESMTNAIRSGEYNLQRLADSLLDSVLPDLDVMIPFDSVCVAVVNDDNTVYAVRPENSGRELAGMSADCIAGKADAAYGNGVRVFPLLAGTEGDNIQVGAFAIRLKDGSDESDVMMCEMISRYMAVALHSCVLRLSSEHKDLEQMREESQRLSYEENRLHVQNMVMDNCLSTLKHETLSYPSRIGMLADNMLQGDVTAESIGDLRELISYYRDIYDILSRNVSRQLDDVLLKSDKIDIADVFRAAEKRFLKIQSGRDVCLEIADTDMSCHGDAAMLGFMLDSLLEQALQYESDGTIRLSAIPDGDFARIVLEDSRKGLPTDNLNTMFTPLWQDNNQHYVVCRQIIREHDEAMGHPGCRINAEIGRDGGLIIWFTLPM